MGLKTTSQNAKLQYEAEGRSPPDFTPRFADFVLQLAFGLKWPHSKFGMKPLKLGGLPSKTLFFPCFGLFRSWLCFTSISLFPFSPYSSKLADWSFGQCFTTLWRVKVIEWKSRDLSVCKDVISDDVFLPPVRRFRTPASCCSQMATYQIWVQTVTTEGSYSTKCLFWFLRMRNAEFLVFSCRGGRWRFSHIIVAVTTVFWKSRRFARSVVVFVHVSNVHGRWEPP